MCAHTAPFVYGEPALRSAGGTDYDGEPKRRYVVVRLRNDGVGVALQVRFRLEAADASWHGDPIPPVRAMRAGEVVPPLDARRTQPNISDDGYSMAAPPPEVGSWEVVVRYADSAGKQWEVRNRRHPPGPLTMRKLRAGWPVARGRVAQW